mmetsp:Transcript_47601/g.54973  ORF Transcript_47601/g.54973 Transcript_47601/m.54973 type:complete len:312 (-) Transcript_47601:375-1310(-)
MVLNYHELTMNEPRDSPARRQQFLVICSIIATWFLYSLYISGILVIIDPVEMSFPGGNFCYKFVARDYVASMGFGRRIRKNIYDILPSDDVDAKERKITKKKKNKLIEEMVYHVYLDDPQLVGGAKTRWLSGVLVSDVEKAKYCDPLFDNNPKIERLALLHEDELEREKKASDVFEQTIYQHVILPSVNSLAFKFPFTNGFLSGLVLSYKIIPEMRILAVEKGESGNIPVIISQCSEEDGTCIHYVPLVEGGDFLVGNPPMDQYLKSILDESFEIWESMQSGMRMIFPFTKKYFEKSPESEGRKTKGEAEL